MVRGAGYPHIAQRKGGIYAQNTWLIVIRITTKQLSILQLFVCVKKSYIWISRNYHSANRLGESLCALINLSRSLWGEANDVVANFIFFTVFQLATCVIFLPLVDRELEKMGPPDSLRNWWKTSDGVSFSSKLSIWAKTDGFVRMCGFANCLLWLQLDSNPEPLSS